MSQRIEETTVAGVGGWQVTAGNLLRGRYQDATGTWCEGPTIELGLYDGSGRCHGEPTVGAGSELTIDGRRWRVTAVTTGAAGDNGWVELAPVAGAA